MRGLLYKDFLILKRNLLSYLVVIVVFLLTGIVQKDASFFTSMIVMLSTMLVTSSISFDDLAHWDKYALSLPISRRTLVAGKYVLALVSLACGIVASLLGITLIRVLFPQQPLIPQFVAIAMITCVAILFLSIMLPVIYRFGVEKSRFLMMALFVLPFLFVVFLSQFDLSLPALPTSKQDIAFTAGCIVVILAALFYLSYRLSVRIYCQKDL